MSPKQKNQIHLSGWNLETKRLIEYFATDIMKVKSFNSNLLDYSSFYFWIGERQTSLIEIIDFLTHNATREEIEAWDKYLYQNQIDKATKPSNKLKKRLLFFEWQESLKNPYRYDE